MTQNDKAVRVRQEVERMEAERWSDPAWAEEYCARAQRQADAARAEARELRAERDRVAADRDKLRADLDHLHVGTIDHERMAGLRAEHAQLRTDLEHAQAALSSTRAALEAAQAAVHTPSPGGSDPGTRNRALPVVPATCGVCDHCHSEGLCMHPAAPQEPRMQVYLHAAPPSVCWIRRGFPTGIRAELAKAGGA